VLVVVEISMGDEDVLVVIWEIKSRNLSRNLSRLARKVA
jgi:hypothetical protein